MVSYLLSSEAIKERDKTSKGASFLSIAIVGYPYIEGDKMTIDLYYHPASAPCRSVIITAKQVGVNLNLIPLDMLAGEHKKPEFIKINPQHSIPTLDDNGFRIWESRAIVGYLVGQYGKNDNLYPMDVKKRTLVDQGLYFDATCLAPRWNEYFYPKMQKKVPGPEILTKIGEALGFLNTTLEGQTWVAGDTMTIADLSIQVTVNTIITAASQITLDQHPNVKAWLDRTNKAAPDDDGIKALKELLKVLKFNEN